MTSPHACIDPKYFALGLQLYQTLYGHFLPICYAKQYPNHTFRYDSNWISFEYDINFIKSVSNEEKMITLNYLNLHKRKKAIEGPLGKV